MTKAARDLLKVAHDEGGERRRVVDEKVAETSKRMGQLLKAARSELSIGQVDLSKFAGVSRMTVVRYERGEIARLPELARMIEALADDARRAGREIPTALEELRRLAATGNVDAPRSEDADMQQFADALKGLSANDRAELLALVKGFALGRKRI